MNVVALWRHPVKSMQGESLPSAAVDATGLADDRRFGVIDAASGKVLSAKREGRLLEAMARLGDGSVEVKLPDGDWQGPGPDLDAELSDWLGRPVHLERATASQPRSYQMNVQADDDDSPVFEVPTPPGIFVDAAPVHVLTTASVAAMAGVHPRGEWALGRFRPTVVVEADGAGFVEDDWIGGTVELGELALSVFAPTVRCAMTVRAQPGLPRDAEIARSVARHHQGNLGVYAVVTRPGRVSVGDDVHVRSGS